MSGLRIAIIFLVSSVLLNGCTYKKTNPCINNVESQTTSILKNYEVICFETVDSYDLNYESDNNLTLYAKVFFPPYIKSSYNAVILSHGSGGVRKYHNRYVEFLTEAGYVVFQINHYLARGIRYSKTFSEVSGITFMNDAYKALEIVKKYDNIDKIAYLGWSQGGVGPILSHFDDLVERISENRFDTAIAIYPYCGFTFDADIQTQTPLLIITGRDDDLTPEEPCITLRDKFAKNDRVFDLVSLKGARHGFDNPFLFFGFEFTKLPSLDNHSDECTLTINNYGNIQTVAGEIIYGPKESADIIDRCSSKGVMVKYNHEATLKSQEHVLNFLSKTLNNMQ